MASVIGREFAVATLQRIAALSTAELFALLDEAVRGRILKETPRSLGHYAFEHALVREGGFALITGEPGIGKRVVLRLLAERLAQLRDPTIGAIAHPSSNLADFYREMGDLFALELKPHNRWGGFKALRERWIAHIDSTLVRPVLLIDELDRADEEFEAYLLELLSDFQVTIPEIGTIAADQPPVVVLTSNRTREIHDALKRRCIYHWIEYPDFDREVAIVMRKVPNVSEALAADLAQAMEKLRTMDLYKPPGVAETLDWAAALAVLGTKRLDPEAVDDTIGVILKYQEDIERVRSGGTEQLLASAG